MRIFSLICALCCSIAFAQTTKKDVQSFELKNGMKVMVLEDHSIPNANMYLFWKVGSRNEVPGITGLSHFFEHMMFNGSKKYGPKMFDRTMEAAGGRNNAYTTENITVYTDWFPSSSLETIFDLEADRIENLNIDSNMVESERGVVLSERSTGLENSNYQFLSEQVKSSAFFAHPYKWSVIGYETDIKAWERQDLVDYFHKFYAPNNCVVVIAGDVETEEVKKLARQYFEPIPGRPFKNEVRTQEPPQNGEKWVTVHKDISSDNIMMAYHVPEATHEDYWALELLGTILSSGNSSRLMSSLVFEERLANQVYAFNTMSIDPNLFYFYGIAAPGTSGKELVEGFTTQIEKLKTDGVTAEELNTARNQLLMDYYRQMETINGKANFIGTYEVFFGDYGMLFDAPEKYKAVTPADIQRVAQKYLVSTNRTVGILTPSK